MSVRSTHKPSTVPIGVPLLGALVVASGWFVLQGAPFVLGCAVDVVLTGAAIVLLVPRHAR
jgi:hypothetical protein